MFIFELVSIQKGSLGLSSEALKKVCRNQRDLPVDLDEKDFPAGETGFVVMCFDVGEHGGYMSVRSMLVVEISPDGRANRVMTGEFHQPKEIRDGIWKIHTLTKEVATGRMIQHCDLVCRPFRSVPLPSMACSS